MRRSLMNIVPALTLALSAGALSAQKPTPPAQPQPARARMQAPMRGMQGQPGAMHRPGAGRARMARHGNPAQRLLGLRTQLGLTSDQVARLQALGGSQTGALKPHSADRLRARADLMEATQKGDMNAAHAALDRIAKMRSDEAFDRLKASHDAAAVLTPDQKAKLHQFRGAARGQMRMRAPGGRGTGPGASRGSRAMRPGGAPGFGG